MSLWTIKKRWYTPMHWVMRRSLGLFLVGVMIFGPGFPFAAFAGDNFVGDSAIYIGDPASRPRPKILFLIDNSQSTMASASGSRYYPGVLYPDNGYDPEDIYRAKTTGDGYLLTFDNDSYAFEELASDACVDIVRNALLTTGLYAGSGTSSAPNLTSQGGCDSTAPSGVVYTLGNFLNYTQFVTNGDDDLDTVLDDDDVCRGHMDDFSTTMTYAEVQTIYNTAGVSMPSYLPATDVLFYDMDEDGVPNGLFPGTPWENGCDICPGYLDYKDLDGDGTPDGCDEDDDGDSVPDTEDKCFGADVLRGTGDDRVDTDTDDVPDDCDDLIDSDDDDIADSEDNCINIPNADQANEDGDSFGDVCDIDADEDLILNDDDNCPLVYNPGQENADGDAYVEGDDTTGGDACDTDDDNDGTPDTLDICPGFSDDVTVDIAPADGIPDNDLDGDGTPDGCDASVDSDDDGVTNAVDNCPTDSNPHQEDNDGDGDGDACDLDDDNDNIPDASDKCPMLASVDNNDTDSDGLGNPCDNDDDGDGVLDQYDFCPLGVNTDDVDGDLIPDLCDDTTDTDGDGIVDGVDNCKTVINTNQANADPDALGDACDTDDDNDAVDDPDDKCHGYDDSLDDDKDGIPDACDGLLDDDKDGVPNTDDQCKGPAGVALVPAYDDRIDADKDSTPDCIDPKIDSDGDGVDDSADQCPGKNDNIDVDEDGTPDGCDGIVDSDKDGEADSSDKCPGSNDSIDVDKDGLPDSCDSLIDSDRDGVADLNDQCKGLVGEPLTPATDDRIDTDLDGVPDCTGDLVDTDRDSVSDATDQCPGYDDSIDVDDDGKPDGCDPLVDTDGDGVADAVDQCRGALGELTPATNDKIDDDEDNIPDCNDGLVDIDKDYVDDRFEDPKCIGLDDRIDVDKDFIPDCNDSLIDSDGDNVPDTKDLCEGFDDNLNADAATGDTVPDGCDVCPGFNDADDKDFDGFPDGCDKANDSDKDGISNVDDLCPGFDDKIQSDGDGIPDGCDPHPFDTDNDGVDDIDDVCPGTDDTINLDKDAKPDCKDDMIDSDFDNVPDDKDVCPGFPDNGVDIDQDGLTDPCDPMIDSDKDGVADVDDQCKGPAGVALVPAYDDRIDADKDGIPDCKVGEVVDSDFDGVEDSKDVCAGENDNIDVDKDLTPDCKDDLIDSDRDTVADSVDQCAGSVGGPLTAAYDDRIDVDKDGIPDCADTNIDSDGDGVTDADDVCKGPVGVALVPAYDDRIDVDKDSVPDCKTGEVVDSDHDGVADSAPDKCPGFDDKIDVDKDGEPDGCDSLIDSDGDGVADAADQCPGKNDKTDVDQDGIPDGCDILIDSDRDDIADADDKCEGPVGGPLTAAFDDRIDVDKDNIPDCSDPKIDSDHDSVADDVDNCPTTHNTDQTNTDMDKYVFASPQMTGGDACDVDDDGDLQLDVNDNCPLSVGLPANQPDVDNDGIGDGCDPLVDTDGDTVADDTDNCKDISNTNQSDADTDGVGDVCDTDDDNDGVLDTIDKCQGYPDGVDVDTDGIPDGCDEFVDTDKDGVEDANDNCLTTQNTSQLDTDYDGFGDACDSDDDGDGVDDGVDNCPLSYGKSDDQTNTDSASGDTQGDVCDTDDDGDGVADGSDNCRTVANSDQKDSDSDVVGDVCDPDIDGDGVDNGSDQCPGLDDELWEDVDGDTQLDCGEWPNTTSGDQCEGDDAICGCTADNYPPYDELIVEVADPKTNNTPWVDNQSGAKSRYRLIQKHTAATPTYENVTNDQGVEELKVGGNKPGWSDNWREYWETVPDDTPLTPAPDGGWEAGKQFWLPAEYPCPTGASLETEPVPIADANQQNGGDLSLLMSLSQAMPTLSVAAASIMTFFSFTSEEAEAASQQSVIYDAIDMVVSSAYNSAHFGAMTYGSSPEKGGRIIHGVGELSDKSAVDEWLKDIPGGELNRDPNTSVLNSNALRPQATALYDAGYYFGAGYDPVNASQMSGQTFTPTDGNCGYNHIILITNGLPNESTLSPMDTMINGEDDGDTIDETTYAQGTHYSDDVAYYLNKKVDLTPENKRVGKDITVHTVLAFAPEDELIERTAAMGGGEYYHAYNANQLAEALQNLLVRIVAEEDTAFVAPVVPASTTNRTISSDRVYLGLFKPQIDEAWIGNIKKYRVSQGTQLLDGKTPPEPATDPVTGDFIEKSNSYWGTIDENGDTVPDKIKCSDGEKLYASGDGGLANCGGVGGTLATRNLLDDSPTEPYTGVRNIYTYPASTNPKDLTHATNRLPTFTTNNPISNALINTAVLDVSTADERQDVLRFVQGFDIKDTNNPDAQRSWLLGDILHSRPVVFNYSSYTPDQENDCSLNTSVIYVGANDGMIHAFRDCDGREIWAFVPPQVLPGLKDGLDGTHQYFVDSPPVAYVHDTNSNGIVEATTDPTVDQTGDRVVLVFGLRRGGSTNDVSSTNPWGGYFAIDVSNRDKPVFLFSVDSSTTGLEAMGQSWSQPRLSKVKVGGLDKVVAFVAGGYDKYEDLRFGQTQKFPTLGTDTIVPEQVYDSGVSVFSTGATSADEVAVGSSPYTSTGAMRGAGMYAIEIATLTGTAPDLVPDTSSAGNIVWSYDYGATKSAGKDPNMLYSIASDMTLGDLNGDSYADVIYVGDTGGRMWRFDVSGTDPNLWDGNIIFDTNPGYEEFYTPYNGTSDRSKLTTPTVDDSDVGRKIFYKPAVSVINNKPTLWFGTGDRAHPLNQAVVDRLYMVVDDGQTTVSGINEKNLVDLTDDPLQSSKYDVLNILSKLNPPAKGPYNEPDYYYGWMIKMNYDYENDTASNLVGEKMLAAPVMFNNEAFFTTYAPLEDPSAGNPCAVGNLGTSKLYQLSSKTGESIYNYDESNDTDTLEENSRAHSEDGKVLKRSDRVRTLGQGIPSGIVTLIDASGKVTMMISSSNRVETTSGIDVKTYAPLYWMQW